jgi:hypothetical protein
MMIMRLLLVASMLGLSACAALQRSERSGYSYEEYNESEQPKDLYEQKADSVESEAKEELGLDSRPLSTDEANAVETRVKLKRMESRLETKREKKQYYGVRSALKNDQERIYFLSLPTIEARERWAQTRGLGGDESYSDDIAKVIESNDIALGMTQKAVMQSWGDPDAVETAGSAVYGYERWKYNRYVSGNEGYQKELRVVYFEGGRVVGWERP